MSPIINTPAPMPLFIYKPIEEHFSWSMKQFGTSWTSFGFVCVCHLWLSDVCHSLTGDHTGHRSWVMIYLAHRVASVNYLDNLSCIHEQRLARRECPRAGSGWAWPRTLQWQCVKVTSTTTTTRVILIVCLNREHEATCQTSLHNLQLATFCTVCSFKYLN